MKMTFQNFIFILLFIIFLHNYIFALNLKIDDDIGKKIIDLEYQINDYKDIAGGIYGAWFDDSGSIHRFNENFNNEKLKLIINLYNQLKKNIEIKIKNSKNNVELYKKIWYYFKIAEIADLQFKNVKDADLYYKKVIDLFELSKEKNSDMEDFNWHYYLSSKAAIIGHEINERKLSIDSGIAKLNIIIEKIDKLQYKILKNDTKNQIIYYKTNLKKNNSGK